MRAEQPPGSTKIGNIMNTSQFLLTRLFNGSRPQRTRVLEVNSTVDRDALTAGELRVTVAVTVTARAGSETRTLTFTGEDAVQFVELSVNRAGLSPQG
jgi:hypothetical protein